VVQSYIGSLKTGADEEGKNRERDYGRAINDAKKLRKGRAKGIMLRRANKGFPALCLRAV